MKSSRGVQNLFRSLILPLDPSILWPEGPHLKPASDSLTLEDALLGMMARVIAMTRMLWRCVSNCPKSYSDDIRILVGQLHHQEDVITRLLASAGSEILWDEAVIRFPASLERVGDTLEIILRCCIMKEAEGLNFSDKADAELDRLFALIIDMMNNVSDAFSTPNEVILKYIITQGAKLDRMLNDFQKAHWERIGRGNCAPESCSIYLAILDSVESTSNYLLKICNAMLRMQSELT